MRTNHTEFLIDFIFRKKAPRMTPRHKMSKSVPIARKYQTYPKLVIFEESEKSEEGKFFEVCMDG